MLQPGKSPAIFILCNPLDWIGGWYLTHKCADPAGCMRTWHATAINLLRCGRTRLHCRRDYDEGKSAWVWAREAPASQKAPGGGDAVKKLKKKVRGA
jgi:hypothetical protein